MPPLNTFSKTALTLALGQAIFSPVQAATITVNDASDDLVNTGCTLREAIESANSNLALGGCATGFGDDTIIIDSSVSTITLSSELPAVNSSVTIVGQGQQNTIISGGGNSRIISVTPDNELIGGDLTLSRLTLSDGVATGINHRGGAIYITGSSLTLDNVTVSNNSSNSSANTRFAYSRGGGIFSSDSTVSISNSTISNNASNATATATSNTSALAVANGGGISSIGSTVSISNSTISNNVSNSTATIPSPADGFTYAYANGGGIYSSRSTVSISNSTISNNANNATSTAIKYARGGARGGGIIFRGSALSISNSTLSNNASNASVITAVSGPYASEAYGGAIFSDDDDGDITVTNSILSGNMAADDGSEILVISPTSSSITNNVIGSNQSTIAEAISGFTPDATNVIATSDHGNVRINAIIEPLADNGGDTLTHALPDGSPAIDSGNNVICLTTDQRSEPRSDGACDIGSFELQTMQEESLFVVPLSNGKAVIFGL